MLRIPRLAMDQIEEFRTQGCLVVREAFPAGDVERLSAWATELAAWPERPGRHWVFHEKSLRDPGRLLIHRIENICPFHEGFAELAEVLNGPVSQLLGEEGVLFKEKVNYKMAGGDGFKAHQDSQAGWGTYAPYFVTVAVSIDATTPENGCLEVAPGFHRDAIAREWEPLTEKDLDGVAFQAIPTAPGDTVFFDSFVPHRSDPNLSGTDRRVYFATYNRLSDGDHLAAYYADKHRSFPPDVERDPDKEYVFRV